MSGPVVQKKKKGQRDLTEEERKLILDSCGARKQSFLMKCFAQDSTVAGVSSDTVFIEASLY